MDKFANKLQEMVKGILSNQPGKAELGVKPQNSIYGFKSAYGKTPTFLTPKQLSEHLQVSEKTLERMRKDGSGPPYIRNISKRIRYPLVGLESWLAAHTENSANGDDGL